MLCSLHDFLTIYVCVLLMCLAWLVCVCVHVGACVQLDIQSRLTKVHSLSLSSDSTEESFCTVRPDQVCTALVCETQFMHVNFIVSLSLICIYFNLA